MATTKTRSARSPWNWFKQLEELGARRVTEPIVIERNIITSGGPFTAMEVAFEFLGMLRTEADASRVREMMGF